MELFNELLNNIDPLLVVVCCGLLCAGGVVVFIVLPIVGGVFDICAGIFEVAIDIVSGGPMSWCGCIVVLGACGICGFLLVSLLSVLSTCGTPDAVNFCRFF